MSLCHYTVFHAILFCSNDPSLLGSIYSSYSPSIWILAKLSSPKTTPYRNRDFKKRKSYAPAMSLQILRVAYCGLWFRLTDCLTAYPQWLTLKVMLKRISRISSPVTRWKALSGLRWWDWCRNCWTPKLLVVHFLCWSCALDILELENTLGGFVFT